MHKHATHSASDSARGGCCCALHSDQRMSAAHRSCRRPLCGRAVVPGHAHALRSGLWVSGARLHFVQPFKSLASTGATCTPMQRHTRRVSCGFTRDALVVEGVNVDRPVLVPVDDGAVAILLVLLARVCRSHGDGGQQSCDCSRRSFGGIGHASPLAHVVRTGDDRQCSHIRTHCSSHWQRLRKGSIRPPGHRAHEVEPRMPVHQPLGQNVQDLFPALRL